MLEILAKNHDTWIRYAYLICKDEELSKDLVQEMYLKLHKKSKDKADKRYVFRTINSLFIDNIRKRKNEISLEYIFNLETENNSSVYELKECLSKLKMFDRGVLQLTHEYPLRQAQDLTGVHYTVLNYHKQKALNKLRKLYNE